jgi:hypothetical protein
MVAGAVFPNRLARCEVANPHFQNLSRSATCEQLQPNHRSHRRGHKGQGGLDKRYRHGLDRGRLMGVGSAALQAGQRLERLVDAGG